MKKILFLSILNCLMFFSCKKTGAVVNTALTGKWILVETLTDPGDGSGEWMPVNTPDYFIKFEQGNSVESNLSRGNGNPFQYKIVNDSSLYLIYPESDTVHYIYGINGNVFILEGGCYEICEKKFRKKE